MAVIKLLRLDARRLVSSKPTSIAAIFFAPKLHRMTPIIPLMAAKQTQAWVI